MENNYNSRENGKVVGGLILVIVGAALLLRNVGFYIPGFLFSWPMILILVGIYTGVKHNFRNNSWLIMIAVGGFFLVSRFIPDLHLEPYFWPIAIIGVGIIFILKPRSKYDFKSKDNTYDYKNDWKAGVADSAGTTDTGNAEPDSSDFVRINSVFSGVNRRVLSKNFQGARLTSVFGGSELDLTQADIQGPVIIRVDIVFGGANIKIPAHWSVQNEVEGIFHGVEEKRRGNIQMEVNREKMIILKGSVVFGGVEIKSY